MVIANKCSKNSRNFKSFFKIELKKETTKSNSFITNTSDKAID